jgi:hypothetical protein
MDYNEPWTQEQEDIQCEQYARVMRQTRIGVGIIGLALVIGSAIASHSWAITGIVAGILLLTATTLMVVTGD